MNGGNLERKEGNIQLKSVMNISFLH